MPHLLRVDRLMTVKHLNTKSLLLSKLLVKIPLYLLVQQFKFQFGLFYLPRFQRGTWLLLTCKFSATRNSQLKFVYKNVYHSQTVF